MESRIRDTATALLSSRGQVPDAETADQLFALVYDELRVVARRLMARQSPGHTLQPTALVNELYLRIIDQTKVGLEDRAHFFALSARAMRQILVNHAATKATRKRGHGRTRLALEDDVVGIVGHSEDLVALDEALSRLHDLKSRVATVVELRFFGGMTAEETALALDVSLRTVTDDWKFARAWMSRELSQGA